MPPRLRVLSSSLTAAALLALSSPDPLAVAGPRTAAAPSPALPGPAPALPAVHAAAAAAPLAPTPPMGWNNWAHYMCNINEATVVANADALVRTGLAAKGYDTVTVDDCWLKRSRDASGNLVADPARFPRGMAWLGRYLHGKGLKFGMYQDAGALTCEKFPGSGTPQGGGADHFAQDARLFASWGVDYLKMDGCNMWIAPGQTKEEAYRKAYTAAARALQASGRPIVLSASAPAYFQQGEWGGPAWYSVLGWVGDTAQLWREGKDVQVYNPAAPGTSRWASVLGNYGYNRWLGRYAGPGNWNDPDFLIAGAPGLTAEESRTQVALWAMMAAPFILSSDVGALSAAGLAALGNEELIRVDQDPLGRQAAVVSTDGSTDVLARPLAGGDRAVAVLNRTSTARRAVVPLAGIGLPSCRVTARNLWTGASADTSGPLTATVPAHGTAVWRLTPRDCAPAVPAGQLTGNGMRCADGDGAARGGAVLLETCTADADQRWTTPADGTLRQGGRCLTAAGSGSSATVSLAACDPAGRSGQVWRYRADRTVATAGSGLCLDAPSATTERLRARPCGRNLANQAWALPA
ncbi:ricin-type beta-trefoil lectin domain protein [Streptomyces bambusae]|uniref:ricin-type beta-trefoil lectin domain protein n=1 Tax=Streptomyces bambusae TaxID=1550616 RepID=UPI001CFE2A4C|nr:ricin-type beta-trefoil lectin domain protein [Streptomyces bambusae]MCB5164133.1 ricin-type beta-trefoil lectin domain protein [Streptomyces bambusae]